MSVIRSRDSSRSPALARFQARLASTDRQLRPGVERVGHLHRRCQRLAPLPFVHRVVVEPQGEEPRTIGEWGVWQDNGAC
jgi:hypothetical protein